MKNISPLHEKGTSYVYNYKVFFIIHKPDFDEKQAILTEISSTQTQNWADIQQTATIRMMTNGKEHKKAIMYIMMWYVSIEKRQLSPYTLMCVRQKASFTLFVVASICNDGVVKHRTVTGWRKSVSQSSMEKRPL